jgi:predicted TIM-barrel fold metal-dependent hydrolase
MIGQSPDELRERLARSGISQALLSPAAADRQVEGIHDTRRMNDLVAQAVTEHPGVFPGGFGLVEVRHEEYAVGETERIMDELGLLGLALHPHMEGYYLDNPIWIAPIFDVLNARSAICLLHSSADPNSGESITAVTRVVQQYPNITFFLGHAFMSEAQRSGAIRLIKETDNSYLDVAYQSDPHLTEELVAAVGSERVVFGTDQPFYDPADVLSSVEKARISPDERGDVLYRNVEAVITQFAMNRNQ